MELNKIEIGKRIHDCRKAQHISLRDFGKMVDLHYSTLSRYEQGDVGSITVDTIKKFAKALHVTPEYLMGISNTELTREVARELWDEEFGKYDFSKEEVKQIIDYAKYLLSKRDK